MNHKFDEMAKGMAQSVTRRQAFKKFGVGLAGMVLARFGLANSPTEISEQGLVQNANCVNETYGCFCVGCKTLLCHTTPQYSLCKSFCASAIGCI